MARDIINLLRFISFGAFLTFGAGYWIITQGRWRRRPEGWWLMALVFIIIEFVSLSVAVQVWGPDFWGRVGFQVIVWSTLAALPVSLIVLLVRAQLRSRRPTRRID